MAVDDPFEGRDLDARYIVDSCIGRGAMGSVYRAQQVLMEREVALKVLHPEIAAIDDVVQRFLREARALGRLSHPNTVRIYEGDRLSDGTLFMSMELLHGHNLSALFEQGAVEPARVVGIAIQVLGSLAEAHAAGMVHRDLKPENLFMTSQVDKSDQVKVLDFGLVKLLEHPRLLHLTRTGTAIGTPGYMSPEAAMSRSVGPGTDIYSLGVVMFELLAGAPLFTAKSPLALVMKHLNEPPPRIREVNRAVFVSPALEGVIRRMLEKEPARRYTSAAEAIEALLETLRPEARRYMSFVDTEPPASDGPLRTGTHPEFAATSLDMPIFDEDA